MFEWRFVIVCFDFLVLSDELSCMVWWLCCVSVLIWFFMRVISGEMMMVVFGSFRVGS